MPTETSGRQGVRSGRGRQRKTRWLKFRRRARNIRHVLKFTTEEDDFLKKGISKHGFGQWSAILRDLDFKFQDGRTVDSLKKRAGMKMPLA